MTPIIVVPAIKVQREGFVLCAESVDSQRAWQKNYRSEQDAYTDAVDLGLAREEYPGGNILRRRLEARVSVEIEQLEYFGFREIATA